MRNHGLYLVLGFFILHLICFYDIINAAKEIKHCEASRFAACTYDIMIVVQITPIYLTLLICSRAKSGTKCESR